MRIEEPCGETDLSVPTAREYLSDVSSFLWMNAMMWNVQLGTEVRPGTEELGRYRDERVGPTG